MKGQMKVKKLNDTGLYISEMDWKIARFERQ